MVPSVAAQSITFQEVAEPAGVKREHDPLGLYPDGVRQQNFYGSGVAWADLNRDGWLDLVVANGEVGSSVFLNNGDGTFDDASGWLGNQVVSASTGVALADVDNDGDLDASIVNYYGEPFLFLAGNRAFNEQGEAYGLNPLLFDITDEPPDNWIGPQSMGVSFGDLNRDGYVDAYVANYQIQIDMLLTSVDGGFFSRTDLVNTPPAAQGFQPVFWDFDNDNDLDIYVSNDFGRNYLFENGGPENDFALTEVAQAYKVAGGNGFPNPASLSMGLAVGDYDNDLDLDLYVTNYVENALYENVGQFGPAWRFRERAAEAGVQYLYNSWGTEFFDLEHDGDLDLVLTGGWIPSEGILDQGRNIDDRLYRNDGGPAWTFSDITESATFGTDQQSGRGLALGDYDRDGDQDIAVWNNSQYDPIPVDGAPFLAGDFALYRNDQDHGLNWAIFRLQGQGEHEPGLGCNRSGIGARMFVTTAAGTQMREVRAGGSFLSQSSLELEFGLASETVIDEVRVRWLCGGEETFAGATANGIFRLVEGSGIAEVELTPIAALGATWTGDGMALTWHHAPWLEASGATVERALGDSEVFETLALVADLTSTTGAVLDDTAAEDTEYVYRLTVAARLGETDASTVPATSGQYSDPTPTLPQTAELGQNYPNPFNPGTQIVFRLPRSMHVELSIFDLRGRRIKTLLDEPRDAGEYDDVVWDGSDDAGNRMASGTYVYTLKTADGSRARTLTLLR